MFENKEEFKEAFTTKIKSTIPKSMEEVNNKDAYLVLVSLLKEEIFENWVKTNKQYREEGTKQAYYFSIEYLIGKLLLSNIINMGLLEICCQGLKELGFNLEELEEEENEAGLGNGGLGRLAACYLDSLASQELPGHGCGIRYKYGLFKQKIVNGNQVEIPDFWLNGGYMWEVRRPEKSVEVRFKGDIEVIEEDGNLDFIHKNYEKVVAVPYDIPIVGYKNNTVNTLRLWSAEVADDIPFLEEADDNYRDKVLDYKQSVESIVEFLYPDDSDYEGKLLRLKQQYFLCSAGLQSIFRTFEKQDLPYTQFPARASLHINDTHPSLLIPEMMRILMDEKNMSWDEAWTITTECVSYTNHTIMSEAMEVWSVKMLKELLPRIYMIIEEINERFCQKLWGIYPGNFEKIGEMAIIADDYVKMANLAVVGSYSINGVSPLHTDILKKRVMKQFYTVFPDRFNNKTNGITHRRWLIKSNPELVNLLTDTIGDSWINNPRDLLNLLKYQNDSHYLERINRIKGENKVILAKLIKERTGLTINTNSIFDIHAKRLHAYKRQLLNILHILYLYILIKEEGLEIYPHTFIFAAKAASGYYFAKQVIKLINTVADVINNDPEINDLIKVVYLENYSVSLAEEIIPAADISEQISTAGMEASGTGNMKFMMNGAVTLGTMDGANVDIYKMVSDSNIYIFGLTSNQVENYYKNRDYSAYDLYLNDKKIKKVLDKLVEPGFIPESNDLSRYILNSLIQGNDHYFVLKDFESFHQTHKLIDREYRDREKWARKCLINIAHSGEFSSDRSISEYAAEIWKIKQKKIE